MGISMIKLVFQEDRKLHVVCFCNMNDDITASVHISKNGMIYYY